MPKLNSLNQSVRDPDLPTWTCLICGKTDLNYKEATDCETVDQRQLQPFSTGLMKALLYIVNRIKSPSFQDLTNVIHTYAYNRLFPSELVHYTLPNTSETRIGIVEKVEYDKKKFPEPPLIHPEAEDLAYCVVDYEQRRKAPKQIMVLPASFCRRRNFSLLNKEKIRFFIRRTCEIRDDFYKPKEMFLEKVQLPPHTKSTVSWSDFSVDPEPNWSQILCMLYRNEKSLLVKAKQVTVVQPDPQQINQRKQQLGPSSTKAQSTSQSQSDFKEFLNRTPSFVEIRDELGNLCSEPGTKNNTSSPAFDQRNYRQEFYDLAREWSSMIPREDLRLADLVPLPENLTPIHTRLSSENFGMALQIVEFYHAFGHHLNIPCPRLVPDSEHILRRDQSNITGEIEQSDLVNPVFLAGGTKTLKVEAGIGLSLSVLEAALIDNDPAGPLGDIFLGLLKVIRFLEVRAYSIVPCLVKSP
ncbi:hypothetical protein Ciccas_009971 [Cichlidogyrus casuarinus]|uniref:WAC domain-containing protein n=1 Tax=Cichlidogyrus casuarinus TaxID=1844966 RepID=A0ABD2PVG3_9PLAT